jgi:hypothetical protein
VKSLKSRLAFMLISKLYRQMYANTGIATDSASTREPTAWRECSPRHRAGCSSRRRRRS